MNDSNDREPRESHRRASPGLGMLVVVMLAAACAPTPPRQITDAVTQTTRESEAPTTPEPSSEALGACYGAPTTAAINSTSAWMWLTIYESHSFGRRRIAYTACVGPGGTHTQKMIGENHKPTWFFRAEMTHANCQQPVDCDTTMEVEQRYCNDSVVLRASPQTCWWEWGQ